MVTFSALMIIIGDTKMKGIYPKDSVFTSFLTPCVLPHVHYYDSRLAYSEVRLPVFQEITLTYPCFSNPFRLLYLALLVPFLKSLLYPFA